MLFPFLFDFDACEVQAIYDSNTTLRCNVSLGVLCGGQTATLDEERQLVTRWLEHPHLPAYSAA